MQTPKSLAIWVESRAYGWFVRWVMRLGSLMHVVLSRLLYVVVGALVTFLLVAVYLPEHLYQTVRDSCVTVSGPEVEAFLWTQQLIPFDPAVPPVPPHPGVHVVSRHGRYEATWVVCEGLPRRVEKE